MAWSATIYVSPYFSLVGQFVLLSSFLLEVECSSLILTAFMGPVLQRISQENTCVSGLCSVPDIYTTRNVINDVSFVNESALWTNSFKWMMGAGYPKIIQNRIIIWYDCNIKHDPETVLISKWAHVHVTLQDTQVRQTQTHHATTLFLLFDTNGKL